MVEPGECGGVQVLIDHVSGSFGPTLSDNYGLGG